MSCNVVDTMSLIIQKGWLPTIDFPPMVMSASLSTMTGLMNSIMSQSVELLSWSLFSHWLKTYVLFAMTGFVMENIQERVVRMAYVFWKTSHKESIPLTSQGLDDLYKCLKVVNAYILKTEEKVAALLDEVTHQQKALLQLQEEHQEIIGIQKQREFRGEH
uniref:Uncharacterized protein n=1 Tax=Nelumbo nucifera TaxID=4432 RepID=A0A822XPX3_NELNU|nr:TPA_asm: hypothetical protein HUJ06_023186 [Nelumbo nucifera]